VERAHSRNVDTARFDAVHEDRENSVRLGHLQPNLRLNARRPQTLQPTTRLERGSNASRLPCPPLHGTKCSMCTHLGTARLGVLRVSIRERSAQCINLVAEPAPSTPDHLSVDEEARGEVCVRVRVYRTKIVANCNLGVRG
jgi:hypothetical protein